MLVTSADDQPMETEEPGFEPTQEIADEALQPTQEEQGVDAPDEGTPEAAEQATDQAAEEQEQDQEQEEEQEQQNMPEATVWNLVESTTCVFPFARLKKNHQGGSRGEDREQGGHIAYRQDHGTADCEARRVISADGKSQQAQND